jgi:hypothetical protein
MNHEATFVKRPVQVQAVQYTRRFAWPDWLQDRISQGTVKVALSDAEEAIDDECRERVVTASDCIEIIRNLGAEPEVTK